MGHARLIDPSGQGDERSDILAVNWLEIAGVELTQIKAARLRQEVRLGRYTFQRAFVEINPAFPLVNLGSTPLQHFAVTFDQRRLLVRFDSSQKVLHLDASPTTMQLINGPKREASDRKLVPIG